MKKKSKWSTFLLLLIFILGLSVMLYPTIGKYWNSRTQSQAIVDYESALQKMETADTTRIWEQAQAYNEALAGLRHQLSDYEQVAGYDRALSVDNSGMMGYLTIDVLNLRLPVYHGTSDETLGQSVGHLEGTSLPTGGKSTHCVVSAHRGLPTATLFTHLDHMEQGDIFQLNVCDQVLTYQVDLIQTVDPSDTSHLQIVPGEDYCTLLTCTPYGVNTHRLLVRGRRIENPNDTMLYVASDGHQIDILIVSAVVAIPILITIMLVVLLKPVRKDREEEWDE